MPQLLVFTDASKKGLDVGMGWIVCEGDYLLAENYSSGKELNIHSAELTAIVEVMELLKGNL